MPRADFHLLTDDEIRNALDVATVRLCGKLWPKALAIEPRLKDSYAEFFDHCKLTLAKAHGVQELFTTEGV